MLVQHVLFAALVGVGAGRGLAGQGGSGAVSVLGAAALLLAWYAVGARRAGRQLGVDETGTGADGSPPATGRWLVGLVAAWLLAVVASVEMVWVAFALWLLAGRLLPPRRAGALGVLVLAVVVARGGHAEDWSTAAVVGPVLGCAFALALSRTLQVLARDNAERGRLVASLVAAQEQAETLQAELALAEREAGVLAERARLSRDIHDTLAQGFSSILLLARASGATPDEDVRARLLAQIEASAADHLQEARQVVAALAPAALEHGLAEALLRVAERLRQETGAVVDVRTTGRLPALPTPVQVALLRTVQSAVANVRQHAGARSVLITLGDQEDEVVVEVVDDGTGFDPAAVEARLRSQPAGGGTGGYGLQASRERLRELGGRLEVRSAPGEGTTVRASLPFEGVPVAG